MSRYQHWAQIVGHSGAQVRTTFLRKRFYFDFFLFVHLSRVANFTARRHRGLYSPVRIRRSDCNLRVYSGQNYSRTCVKSVRLLPRCEQRRCSHLCPFPTHYIHRTPDVCFKWIFKWEKIGSFKKARVQVLKPWTGGSSVKVDYTHISMTLPNRGKPDEHSITNQSPAEVQLLQETGFLNVTGIGWVAVAF